MQTVVVLKSRKQVVELKSAAASANSVFLQSTTNTYVEKQGIFFLTPTSHDLVTTHGHIVSSRFHQKAPNIDWIW